MTNPTMSTSSTSIVAEKADIPTTLELVAQAHDQLHKGAAGVAHELLHKALGLDNSVGAQLPSDPLAHRIEFNAAFVELCRLHNVKAAYLAADTVDAQGRTRLLAGGDQDIDAFLMKLLKGAR